MLDQLRGKQDVMVVNLDNYDIIIDLDFLRKTKIVLMLYLNVVKIAIEGYPCCNVATMNVIKGEKSLISIIAIEKELRKQWRSVSCDNDG